MDIMGVGRGVHVLGGFRLLFSLQSILCQRTLANSARSADISQDGSLVVVGQTNGEFLILSTSDLSVLRQKRDRSKTLQVVR